MNITAKRDELVAGIVALSAFGASAQHIYDVCVRAGNIEFVAALHPVGVDGLIYIGIRAMQRGRRWAGGGAIAYGAIASLMFNAASYGGIEMPVMALAACMPLSMLAAFVIVHGGGHVAPGQDMDASAEDVSLPPRTSVPLWDVSQGQDMNMPAGHKDVSPGQAGHKDVSQGQDMDMPKSLSWDMDKAIRLMDEGQSNTEIASAVGTGAKTIQRTRRALKMIREGEALNQEISQVCGMSVAQVARIRGAR